jgi:hypothetical protein
MGGQGLRDQMASSRASVYGQARADAEQPTWLPYQELPGAEAFYTPAQMAGDSSQDARIDPEALARYLDERGYQIGQAEGKNQNWRWLQDAQGNPVLEPRNYYTNDKTAALLGIAGILGPTALHAFNTGAFGGTAPTSAAGGDAGVKTLGGLEPWTPPMPSAPIPTGPGPVAPIPDWVTPGVLSGVPGVGVEDIPYSNEGRNYPTAESTQPGGGQGGAPSSQFPGSPSSASSLFDKFSSWATKNPIQAAQLAAGIGSMVAGGSSGSSGSSNNVGIAAPSQAGLTATPAAPLQRQYVAPAAGYRPGFDAEHRYFSGIGPLGTGA